MRSSFTSRNKKGAGSLPPLPPQQVSLERPLTRQEPGQITRPRILQGAEPILHSLPPETTLDWRRHVGIAGSTERIQSALQQGQLLCRDRHLARGVDDQAVLVLWSAARRSRRVP